MHASGTHRIGMERLLHVAMPTNRAIASHSKATRRLLVLALLWMRIRVYHPTGTEWIKVRILYGAARPGIPGPM